jgi:hypothetical protein
MIFKVRVEARRRTGAHHDAGDGRGDPSLEELESVAGYFLRGVPVLALGTRGYHAWLQEDALKHHVVLGHVVERLRPHLLRDLEGPLDAVLTVEHDLRLNNWHQAIVLKYHHMRDLHIIIILCLSRHCTVEIWSVRKQQEYLRDGSVTGKTPGSFLDSKLRWAVRNADNSAPARELHVRQGSMEL